MRYLLCRIRSLVFGACLLGLVLSAFELLLDLEGAGVVSVATRTESYRHACRDHTRTA